MSEPENTPPKAPTVKTSAVPLKKETVRITLRPSAPPSEPLAPVAPPPPTAQVPAAPAPMPGGPPRPPTIGTPTVPLRSAPPPSPMGGPRATGPLAPPPPVRPMGGAPVPPSAPVGSKTIPLQQQPGVRPTAPVGRPTGGLSGAPSTQPLPKATVKLQKTQPVGGGPPTASVSTAQIRTAAIDDDEEVDREAGLQGLSIVALVAGIAALLIAFMSWQGAKPFTHPEPPDSSAQEAWAQAGTTDWKIPAEYNPYSTKRADGTWASNYAEKKPVIPKRE